MRYQTKHNKAFTLVEVLVAIVLVGFAIASLLAANISFTRANGAGADLSTAEFLIEQVREMTAMVAVVDPQTGTTIFGAEEGTNIADYDDLDDFDGAQFSPPINTDRQSLNDFSNFSQQITVENISEADFTQVVGDHSSDFVRVTVTVFLDESSISSLSWIRAQY